MKTQTRREFLTTTAAASATLCMTGSLSAAPTGKKTFTILHTNDLHSNLIGPSPASDYSPFSLNDDKTRGGFARLATLITQRKAARTDQGPVLILDAGDYSMGTAFAAAIRETGGELQMLAQMGFDATTFGNHDFDLGPDGTALSSTSPPRQAAFRRWSHRTPLSREMTPSWMVSSASPKKGNSAATPSSPSATAA